MAVIPEKVDLAYVNKVLVKHLDLDPGILVPRNTRLSGLVGICGESFEPADLLDIFHELEINASDYCSGERLRLSGVRMLAYAIQSENVDEDVKRFGNILINDLAKNRTTIIPISDFAGQVTPGYLIRAKEYDSLQKLKATEAAKMKPAA